MEYCFEYDPVTDALCIKIRSGKIVDGIEAKKDVIFDLGKKGEIIGVEILNFSKSDIDLKKILIKGIETTEQMVE